jgi:hypothetical protein
MYSVQSLYFVGHTINTNNLHLKIKINTFSYLAVNIIVSIILTYITLYLIPRGTTPVGASYMLATIVVSVAVFSVK